MKRSVFIIGLLLLSITVAVSWDSQRQGRSAEAADLLTGPDDVSAARFLLDGTGVIEGTVWAADGVTPLENVGVTIDGMDVGTCTDAGGHYMLIVPLDTAYRVQAGGELACGGDLYAVEWWQEAAAVDLAIAITLTETESAATGVDFTLDEAGGGPVRAPGLGMGEITGTVTDGTNPIENAQVCVQEHPWGPGHGCGQTIADGTYLLPDLPPGDYSVDVSAPGYAKELYNNLSGYSDRSLANAVPVLANTTTDNINFVLAPGGTITGTVRNFDGSAYIGDVQIDTAPWGGFGTCSSTSDGTFTLTGLPLGVELYIYAGGNGGCSERHYMREYWNGQPNLDSATGITLTDTNPVTADFTLEMGGTVTGTVTDGTNPIENAQVCIQEYSYSEGYGCWNTDPSGVYTIPGLPTGAYRLDAGASGFAKELYEEKLYFSNHSQATPLNVTAGATVPGIQLHARSRRDDFRGSAGRGDQHSAREYRHRYRAVGWLGKLHRQRGWQFLNRKPAAGHRSVPLCRGVALVFR